MRREDRRTARIHRFYAGMSGMNSPMPDSPAIHHSPSRSRLETTVDGSVSVLDYHLQGRVMTITHTGVPPALRGRGIAASLVQAAFALAKEQGWRVAPACSYAAAWAQRHPGVAAWLA